MEIELTYNFEGHEFVYRAWYGDEDIVDFLVSEYVRTPKNATKDFKDGIRKGIQELVRTYAIDSSLGEIEGSEEFRYYMQDKFEDEAYEMFKE